MLLAWASMAVPIFCNLYARRILASLEIAAAILHVLGLVVFVVVLVVMARRSTADFVFQTSFFGRSGWKNEGVQWCIGLLAVIFPFGGFDSLLHMADEVKHAQVSTSSKQRDLPVLTHCSVGFPKQWSGQLDPVA